MLAEHAEVVRARMAEYDRAYKVLEELDRRSMEVLRLYEPSDFQERYHQCTAKEALIQGGNQVGKSFAGFMEVARAVLGLDPHGKYPKKGRAYMIGWDEGHISRVIHRYLLEPGIVDVFKDDNGQWQVYKPWLHDGVIDPERLIESPPLIPERFIKNIAWKSRAMNIFQRIDLTTGWELHAFSSRSAPAQGFKADLFHIDEDIQERSWYREIAARLLVKKGYLRWTALPHGKNDAMRNLILRCEEEAEKANADPAYNPTSVHFRATIYDNPYISDEARETAMKIWADEGDDILRQRAFGELVTDSCMVYPSFNKRLHDAMEPGQQMSRAREIYIERNGQPPEDWMLSMVVDPGHTMCGVLFIATPPPELGNQRFVFGEIAIQRSTSMLFATEVEKYMRVNRLHGFTRFIIDAHGGALTSSETGISPRAAYSRDMKSLGIQCFETESSFISGSDDIAGRETCLRNWLSIQPETGEPKVFIDVRKCPRLVRTLPNFMKKEVNGIVQDEANRRLECHHIECLEYGSANGLEYVKPPDNTMRRTRAQKIIDGIERRKKQRAAKRLRPGVAGGTITLGPIS